MHKRSANLGFFPLLIMWWPLSELCRLHLDSTGVPGSHFTALPLWPSDLRRLRGLPCFGGGRQAFARPDLARCRTCGACPGLWGRGTHGPLVRQRRQHDVRPSAFLLDTCLGKIYNNPSRFIHQLQWVLGMHHYIDFGLYVICREFYKCIIILFWVYIWIAKCFRHVKIRAQAAGDFFSCF